MQKQRRCAKCGEVLGIIRIRNGKPGKGDYVVSNNGAGNTSYVKIKWMKNVAKVTKGDTSSDEMSVGVTCKKCDTYHEVDHSTDKKYMLKAKN